MKPIKVELEQGSENWLLWRRSHITASDCGAILGLSPYKTPRDVYFEKIEGNTQFKTYAMERGLALEATARDWIQIKYNQELEPGVFQHAELSYVGASLDAITPDREHIHEIKIPMDKMFNTVKGNNKPNQWDEYQCRHQLLVSELKEMHIHYFHIADDEIQEVLTFKIDRDDEKLKSIKEHLQLFWKFMVNRTEPPLTEKDYDDVSDKEYLELETVLDTMDRESKIIETDKAATKARMLEICGEKRVKGKIFKTIQGGSGTKTDWKKISSELRASKSLIRKHSVEKKPYWYFGRLKKD